MAEDSIAAVSVATRVFVRGLLVEALIGIHAQEKQRRQPLSVDVELEVAAGGWRALTDTVDYETIAQAARAIAAGGHIGLVEAFAKRLAEACLAMPRVLRAKVRIEKPGALAPHAAAAGVEIEVAKG